MPLPLAFFDRPARQLAPALLGKIIVSRGNGRLLRARVVETEAYLGPRDRASHAYHGRTARTEVLFGPPGRAYVYLIYGIHELLNVVAGKQEGEAQCVLIRAADPLGEWSADLGGPGKLTKRLGVGRSLNGRPLDRPPFFFTEDRTYRPEIVMSARIGIDYAGEWRDAPLRFFDAKSRAVSKRPARARALR